MIFYHGTTLDAARQIQKQGLVPHRESAYQLVDDRGDYLRDMPGEDKPYIYLQDNPTIARNYAIFRANYERAHKGEQIEVDMLLSEMYKTASEQNPNAKPALITFDIPSTIARKLKRDPQNWQGGHVCLCMIPPKYITSVTEVR